MRNFCNLLRKKYKLELVFVYIISLYFGIVTQWTGEETLHLCLNLMFQFFGWHVSTSNFYYKHVSGTIWGMGWFFFDQICIFY